MRIILSDASQRILFYNSLSNLSAHLMGDAFLLPVNCLLISLLKLLDSLKMPSEAVFFFFEITTVPKFVFLVLLQLFCYCYTGSFDVLVT
jgi:hypothetical protein